MKRLLAAVLVGVLSFASLDAAAFGNAAPPSAPLPPESSIPTQRAANAQLRAGAVAASLTPAEIEKRPVEGLSSVGAAIYDRVAPTERAPAVLETAQIGAPVASRGLDPAATVLRPARVAVPLGAAAGLATLAYPSFFQSLASLGHSVDHHLVWPLAVMSFFAYLALRWSIKTPSHRVGTWFRWGVSGHLLGIAISAFVANLILHDHTIYRPVCMFFNTMMTLNAFIYVPKLELKLLSLKVRK